MVEELQPDQKNHEALNAGRLLPGSAWRVILRGLLFSVHPSLRPGAWQALAACFLGGPCGQRFTGMYTWPCRPNEEVEQKKAMYLYATEHGVWWCSLHVVINIV